MSVGGKIDTYRKLKQLAAESRHLRARLQAVLDDRCTGQRTLSSLLSCDADGWKCTRSYVTSSSETGSRAFCHSSVCVPLHSRCDLVLGERSGTSREEAELGAVTEALATVSSATDWRCLVCVTDSDLYASFIALLACLNAFAVIRLGQNSRELRNIGVGLRTRTQSKKAQFRATVGVELASMDKSGVASGNDAARDMHTREPLCGEVDEAHRAGESTPFVPRTERHFDVGVTGEWAATARDAVKLALYTSLAILQDHVVEEWQGSGKEAALLLNEVARGSNYSGNLEVLALDSALRGGGSCRAARRVHATVETPSLRFRCEASRDSVTITTANSSETNRCAASRFPRPDFRVEGGNTGKRWANLAERNDCAVTDLVRLPCAFVPVCVTAPHVDGCVHRNGAARCELSWPLRCLPAATLLAVAAGKALLQQSATFRGNSQRPIGDSAEATLEESPRQLCAKSGVLHWWSYSPLFSALAHPRRGNVTHASFSSEASLPFHSATVKTTAQNSWQCPDVIVMIAQIRSALSLPSRSFPDITFEQTAVHDPARRVDELAHGWFGDVDVLTKVHVRWPTPRGRLTASAVSDPALHAAHAVSAKERSTSSTILSCDDTGSHRGPLPLLVAAVCSLYDAVFGRTGPEGAGCYPMVPVRNPNSRAELDFLLYSWFNATPQTRCFSISAGPPNAASEAPLTAFDSPRDGETRFEVGPSMTRAMLFYDLLGQRVLFAETHAATAEDAVARVDRLAVEANSLGHVFFRPTSRALRRPFRSIEQQRHWQSARERLLGELLRFSLATPRNNASPPLGVLSTDQMRRAVHTAMRACLVTCASELGSLWTVLQALVEASVLSADATLTPSESASPAVCARFLEDGDDNAGLDVSVHDATHDQHFLQRWLGGPDSQWNSRPLGKETAPPSAGVMELHLFVNDPLQGEAHDGQALGAAVVLRCRVDGLRGSWVTVEGVEWACKLSEDGKGTVLTATSVIASGALPALQVLCQRALQHIYGDARHASLVSLLPGIEDILRWCAAAAPLLGDGGYPPYDPRFYAAPKLLGELLQGIAGKYECSYSSPSQRDVGGALASQSEGTADDFGGHERRRDKPSPITQPGTVFYTSKPVVVTGDSSEGGVAEDDDNLAAPGTGQDVRGSRATRPPAVACTLYIETEAGHIAHAATRLTQATPSRSAVHDRERVFVLGRGVGHTKREAWRSAAWQAVRLQFPHVLAQLEAHRDIAEVQRQPALLARLAPRDAAARDAGGPAAMVYKLRFDFSQPLAQLPSPQMAVRCKVKAVRTDGSEVCVCPADASDTVAAAASAGGAFVAAAAAVLAALRAAARPQPAAWSDGWATFAGYHVAGLHATSSSSWGPSAPPAIDVRPYARWRATTHYAKSLWHAYVGALSACLDGDVAVRLLSADGAELGAGAARGTLGRAAAWQRRAVLSRVQLRVRPGGTEEPNQTRDACSVARPALWRSSFTSFSSFPSSSVDAGAVAAFCLETGRAASAAEAAIATRTVLSSGTLVDVPPACLLTPHTTSGALTTRGEASSLALLQAATGWLAELTQQCRLSPSLREELRGLLCARAADVAHIERSRRWTPAERVEALLLRWLGRPAHVWVRRADGGAPASLWIAEAVVQLDVAPPRHHDGLNSNLAADGDGGGLSAHAASERSLRSRRDGRSHVWVAAHASGPTSDEATFRLYRDVRAALHEVLPSEPPM